jgi:uncharacterized protein
VYQRLHGTFLKPSRISSSASSLPCSTMYMSDEKTTCTARGRAPRDPTFNYSGYSSRVCCTKLASEHYKI